MKTSKLRAKWTFTRAIATLLFSFLFVACADGFRPLETKPINGIDTPKQTRPNPTPTPTPAPINPTLPNVEQFVRDYSNSHPGLINDCTGQPIANAFLIEVVRALQANNARWGFFKKPDGRIPRDILAYAWGTETEGTHNTFVVDFVASGCNNSPSDPTFNDPAPSASVYWNVTNPAGYADNGVWSFNP